jgi:hypothetical protein
MTLTPADIEAIAVRTAEILEERGLVAPVEPKLLSAAEVARRLGRSRDWVYAHRAELGAIPLGDGDRPRLGFPLEGVEAYVTARSAGDGSDGEQPAQDRARRRRRPADRDAPVRLLPVGRREELR